MAEQPQLPIRPRFPTLRLQHPPEVAAWAHQMEEALTDMYRLLAARLEDLVTVGLLAERPAANGSLRFYFATDATPPLYFDDGTWTVI